MGAGSSDADIPEGLNPIIKKQEVFLNAWSLVPIFNPESAGYFPVTSDVGVSLAIN